MGRITIKTDQLLVAALSDVGRVRNRNEDSVLAIPEQGLIIVSDGLGGRAAGDVASRMVVDQLPRLLFQGLASIPPGNDDLTSSVIRDIITRLSKELRYQSRANQAWAGMGATLVMALFQNRGVHIASMGDSRAYLYRNGEVKQLTEDHSVVAILVSQGVLTREQARQHESRGQLTRYMGMEGTVYPDVVRFDLMEGDRLVLCSDGLTSEVDDQAIGEILKQSGGVDENSSDLVHAAKAAGGKDNITVVVAEWWGDR